MLDIDALRLTDEEMWNSYGAKYVEGDLLAVADAQLAKALWGIQEWLTKRGNSALIVPPLIELNTALLARAIPRPKDT